MDPALRARINKGRPPAKKIRVRACAVRQPPNTAQTTRRTVSKSLAPTIKPQKIDANVSQRSLSKLKIHKDFISAGGS